MRDDIYLLGEQFEQIMKECKDEEDHFKKLQKQLYDIRDELVKNTKSRRKLLDEIRLNKFAEINEDLTESNQILKSLYDDKKKILSSYCKKNGHNYVTISSEYLGMGNSHTYMGSTIKAETTIKCTVCGVKHVSRGERYSMPITELYVPEIPKEILNSNSEVFMKNGKNLKTILEEISVMEEHVGYLEFLKKEMCKIFQHDFRDNGKCCSCCGQYKFEIESEKAMYLMDPDRLLEFTGLDMPFIVKYPDKELVLNLPTEEQFQKRLIKSKDNEKI